jgi:uncharacterized membrane protein YbaN (DUF454 family)
MRQTYGLIRRLRFLRRPLGAIFLVLALLGFVLPVIPSWPFIIPAVLLLGRRDRWLRYTHLQLRRSLRWLRRSRTNWVRRAGMWLSSEYVRTRRTLTPMIVSAERMLGIVPKPASKTVRQMNEV